MKKFERKNKQKKKYYKNLKILAIDNVYNFKIFTYQFPPSENSKGKISKKKYYKNVPIFFLLTFFPLP